MGERYCANLRRKHGKFCFVTCTLDDNIYLLLCAVTEYYFLSIYTTDCTFGDTVLVVNPIKHVSIFVDDEVEKLRVIFPFGNAVTLISKQ